MELVLKLSKTQHALLAALAPRGAVKSANSLEETAMQILSEGMRSEARRRRINAETVLGVALVEAAERRKERMP